MRGAASLFLHTELVEHVLNDVVDISVCYDVCCHGWFSIVL